MVLYPPMDHILSRPTRLHWAGWETDTYRLQRAGWDLSAEEDVTGQGRWGRGFRVAMRHPEGRMRGVSEWHREDHHAMLTATQMRDQTIELRADLASDMVMPMTYNLDMTHGFGPIDATPQFRPSLPPQSFDDFCRFARMAEQKQLIVPEESVPDLLERILQLQQPARSERIRREVRDERAAIVPVRFHANIVSLADRRAA